MKPLEKLIKRSEICALILGILLACSGCGGGGATYEAASNKTLGEELQDLQQSYDKGIITKKEYDETKKKLIKKYTR